jgi:hypothetical protein
MSTPTLSTVVRDVVGQYHVAGKQFVRAYRAGTERAVGAVNERFASAVNARSLPLVTDSVKTGLIEAQQQVAGFVAFGLGLGANGADATIDQLARRFGNGIERVAGVRSRVEGALDAGGEAVAADRQRGRRRQQAPVRARRRRGEDRRQGAGPQGRREEARAPHGTPRIIGARSERVKG